MMGNAKCVEEGIEFLIFPSPIGLDSNNLTIKLSFNKCLKVVEDLKYIGSFLEKINPRILAKIINEANIICMFTNKDRSRAPHIRKNEL